MQRQACVETGVCTRSGVESSALMIKVARLILGWRCGESLRWCGVVR